MVKVRLFVNGEIQTSLVSQKKRICQVLEENNIDYTDGKVYVNNLPIQPKALDNTLSSVTQGEPRLTLAVRKKDQQSAPLYAYSVSAPRVYLSGGICIIVSALTAEEIIEIKQTMPKLLELKDEKNEPCFAMDLDDDGDGSITEFGAVYGNKITSEGRSFMTLWEHLYNCDHPSVFMEKYGKSLKMLAKIEQHVLLQLGKLSNVQDDPNCAIYLH